MIYETVFVQKKIRFIHVKKCLFLVPTLNNQYYQKSKPITNKIQILGLGIWCIHVNLFGVVPFYSRTGIEELAISGCCFHLPIYYTQITKCYHCIESSFYVSNSLRLPPNSSIL